MASNTTIERISLSDDDMETHISDIPPEHIHTFTNDNYPQLPSPDANYSCDVCLQSLDDYSPEERQDHYNRHFEKPVKAATTISPPTPKYSKWNPKRLFRAGHEEPLWSLSSNGPPPRNYVPGLIHYLKKALRVSHDKGLTKRAVLCHSSTVHIHRELWDVGWGCGYRNFMIACTALVEQQLQPEYKDLLLSPYAPNIRNIQDMIESAWKAGFDPDGHEQLHSLVGSTKWIGTSDLFGACSYRGIPAVLVDFDLKQNPKDGIAVLHRWVVDYFNPQTSEKTPIAGATVHDVLRGASPVVVTDRMPLILQTQGHSRAIVGYEVAKNGNIHLLTFDPSFAPDAETKRAAAALAAVPNHCVETSQRYTPLGPIGNQQPRSTPAARIRDLPQCQEPIEVEESSDDDADKQPQIPQQQKMKTVWKTATKSANQSGHLKHFRMKTPRLRKPTRYQIMYFPLTPPLTEQQKQESRIVTSIQVSG